MAFSYSQSPYSTVSNSYAKMIGAGRGAGSAVSFGGRTRFDPVDTGAGSGGQSGPIQYNVPLSDLRRGSDSININTGSQNSQDNAYNAFLTQSRLRYQNANNLRNQMNTNALMQIGPEKRAGFIQGFENSTGERFTSGWDEDAFQKNVRSQWEQMLAAKTLGKFFKQ